MRDVPDGGDVGGPGASPGRSNQESELPLDTVLDLVVNPHRRAILQCCRESPDGGATHGELLDRVARRLRARTGEEPRSERLLTAFHHVHLPKLREAGVLSYDETADRYHYHADQRLERYLAATEPDSL